MNGNSASSIDICQKFLLSLNLTKILSKLQRKRELVSFEDFEYKEK